MLSLKKEVYKAMSSNQMTIALANLVAKTFGFHDLDDRTTEIVQQHLTDAIPHLNTIQPQLVEAYKSTIKQCYDKGLETHTDAAKLLRRVLKKHNRALVYRRTTLSAPNKRVHIYKYRMI